MKVKKGKTAPVKPGVAANKMAKAETPVKAEAKPSKFKGVKTGLRVQEFQDQCFAANTKAMLTDDELAKLWREEFPNAVAFTAFHVKGARRDYNAGTHSKAYADKKPATPLHEVVVVEGKRQFADGVTARTPKPKDAKAEAPKAAEVKGKTVDVKATAARVRGAKHAKAS